MNVIEDGIIIDLRGLGTTLETPSIENMKLPINVNPSVKVTLLRDEQAENARKPDCLLTN